MISVSSESIWNNVGEITTDQRIRMHIFLLPSIVSILVIDLFYIRLSLNDVAFQPRYRQSINSTTDGSISPSNTKRGTAKVQMQIIDNDFDDPELDNDMDKEALLEGEMQEKSLETAGARRVGNGPTDNRSKQYSMTMSNSIMTQHGFNI